MTDNETTIKEMMDYLGEFVDKRQWQQFHSPKNLAIGIAVETGELLEHFQWISQEESRQAVNDPKQIAQIKEELADVFSYILGMAQTLDIDLSDAFYHKMQKNDKKYPADKYRGKYKLEE